MAINLGQTVTIEGTYKHLDTAFTFTGFYEITAFFDDEGYYILTICQMPNRQLTFDKKYTVKGTIGATEKCDCIASIPTNSRYNVLVQDCNEKSKLPGFGYHCENTHTVYTFNCTE
ncbi:MAG: hypothetical protein AABX14_01235 [Candidatus Aenigmatarchaeota archaeon]